MAYATVAQLRVYLPQASDVPDASFQAVLDRATAIIEMELGRSFALATSPSARVIYGSGTDFLSLPPYTGTISSITSPVGLTTPAYIEQDGFARVTRSSYISPTYGDPAWWQRLTGGDVWVAGAPYTVTANWGYSTYPNDIVEACLELAATIWRRKDAGFSNVVGSETGGVGYEGAYPALVKRILDNYRNDAPKVGVG